MHGDNGYAIRVPTDDEFRRSNPVTGEIAPAGEIMSVGDLAIAHPHLREPIIEGLLRRGETANVIAAPKVGKSWLSYSLALSLATGENWLGRFPCRKGRTLIIDLELHPELIASRIRTAADAMALVADDYEKSVDVLPLRGKPCDLHSIDRRLSEAVLGEYDVIVLDAFYRSLPPGVSESDNGAITQLFNIVDGIADRLDCAWINIHHSTKGSQSEKSVTDVGSGAGSQSRAADAHIILRPHESEGAVVLEAVVRSWAPVEPLPLRWAFPLWRPDYTIDPAQLKGSKTRGEERQTQRDTEGVQAVLDCIPEGKTVSLGRIRESLGCGADRANRLVAMAKREGLIREGSGKHAGRKTRLFKRVK